MGHTQPIVANDRGQMLHRFAANVFTRLIGKLSQRHSPAPWSRSVATMPADRETGGSRTHRLPAVAGTRHAVPIQAGGSAADTCSRQSKAVSAARPRWRAKNRAELSRSYSGTG